MVFSAPEITTVSKPKRNPASAEVMAQKRMRAFMRPSERDVAVVAEGVGMFMGGTVFRIRAMGWLIEGACFQNREQEQLMIQQKNRSNRKKYATGF